MSFPSEGTSSVCEESDSLVARTTINRGTIVDNWGKKMPVVWQYLKSNFQRSAAYIVNSAKNMHQLKH